jgi:hypothetical protein
MANNKEEAGKGMPRPGESPAVKRPYATIDVKATEVEGREAAAGSPGAAKPATPAAAVADPKAAKPEVKAPPGPQPKAAAGPGGSDAKGNKDKSGSLLASLAGRRRAVRLLTHLAAGAVGALIVLGAMHFLATDRQPSQALEVNDLRRRVADMEGVLGTRPNAGMRNRVDELGRSLGTLAETQAKLARDTKALETKVGSGQEIPQELVGRLTRLEDMLATMSAAEPAGQSQNLAAFAGRVAELQKGIRDANARLDSDLSSVRTEAGRLAQRLDGIKGEVEERMRGAAKAADLSPLAAKLGALEQELQGFIRSEADRSANATRVLLTLELANLKRAIDRGERYVEDLARVKKVAGTLNLKPLERYSLEGVPTPPELAKSFRPTANAMLDSEAEKSDASLVDRLLSGARGIVRIRKAGHDAEDASVEATVGRMEGALKENRLDEVLANAKKLPPKAALAGEEWVKKVQARQAVEQALADLEAALKASFGSGPTAGQPASAPAGTGAKK